MSVKCFACAPIAPDMVACKWYLSASYLSHVYINMAVYVVGFFSIVLSKNVKTWKIKLKASTDAIDPARFEILIYVYILFFAKCERTNEICFINVQFVCFESGK